MSEEVYVPMRHGLGPVASRYGAMGIMCLVVACPLAYAGYAGSKLAGASCAVAAIGGCLLLAPLRGPVGTAVQRLLAGYFAGLGLDHLSGVYGALPGGVQIAAPLPVAAAAGVALWVGRPRPDARAARVPTAGALAWLLVAVHLLVAGALVHSWYGYGAERGPAVLAYVTWALLVAVAGWALTADSALRVGLGAIVVVGYTWLAFS